MDFEKFLNDNKTNIWKFEVYESLIVIHIENNGVIEIETDSIDYPLYISHIVNS